jgi:hypothetical protein
VPLVQVAWSDGRVTEPERTRIHEVAVLRGVAPGTPGYAILGRLLEAPDVRGELAVLC